MIIIMETTELLLEVASGTQTGFEDHLPPIADIIDPAVTKFYPR